MTQEEITNIFIKTMQAHAKPRDYDWWIFGAAIAGVIASLAVAYYAFQLNKKQIAIAKKQSEISEEQTAIAKKQTDIMEQQNNIALFEKKFAILALVRQIYINVNTISEFEREVQLDNVSRDNAKKYLLSLYYNIGVNVCSATVTYKEVVSDIQAEVVKRVDQLDSARYMFSLDDKHEKYLERLILLFSNFTLVLCNYLEKKESKSVSDGIFEINKFYEESCYIDYLKEQVYISDSYKDSI